MARYGVGDFSSFVSFERILVCLTFLKKRTSKACALRMVASFNSCRLLPEEG